MNTMNRAIFVGVIALYACVSSAFSQHETKQPLRLVQTITVPNVKGRLDHIAIDVEGKRLFLAGLEQGTFEVIDLTVGKWQRSIPGFNKPQGAVYVPTLNKLFLASGDDATIRVFRGDSLSILASIGLAPGPNRTVYEPHTKTVYVGYGGADAGKNYGEVGIIDAVNDKHIGDIKVPAHPSELILNKAGQKMFVFTSIANQLQVVDLTRRQIVATWPVSGKRPGDAALDESTSRLFIGTRMPPELIVMDSESGRELVHLPTAENMDGVYYDARRKRIYVSGGRELADGLIYAYQQKSADQYEVIGKIPTRGGAGTSFYSPELDRYYVAAPANAKEDAAILVFEPQD